MAGGRYDLVVGAAFGGLGSTVLSLAASAVRDARAYRRQQRDRAEAADSEWKRHIEALLAEHSEMLHSDANRARSRRQSGGT